MTYATADRDRYAKVKIDSTMFLDPTLIKAAKKVYQSYCSFSQLNKKPLGVVIDYKTYKGQLTFREKPILLPRERFIGIDLIET